MKLWTSVLCELSSNVRMLSKNMDSLKWKIEEYFFIFKETIIKLAYLKLLKGHRGDSDGKNVFFHV